MLRVDRVGAASGSDSCAGTAATAAALRPRFAGAATTSTRSTTASGAAGTDFLAAAVGFFAAVLAAAGARPPRRFFGSQEVQNQSPSGMESNPASSRVNSPSHLLNEIESVN